MQEVSSCFHLSFDAAPRTRLAAAPQDVLWRWPPNWPRCWKTHTGLEWFVATRHWMWITQPYTAQNSCCGSRIEACVLRFFFFNFNFVVLNIEQDIVHNRGSIANMCARAASVWGQRWKKRKGESKTGEEWLREERWMLCQHVVLMQLVWVTLSHLCGSCKSSQSFGRLATEEDSTTVMLKAGSTSIGNLIESCSHADLIKVLCSWIVGTVQHCNSLCMALHGSLSTRLSNELYGPCNFY